MSNPEEENQSKPAAKEPIFLERGDGLGWTLNFDRPVSYVILLGILGVSLVICLYAAGVIKL
ncbi:hypothetical protein [Mucilaginibacter sp.]